METLKKAITSLLLSLLLGVLIFGIRFFGVDEQISTIIATVVVIVSLIFFLLIYRAVFRKITLGFLKDELKATDEKAKQFKAAVSKLIPGQDIPPKAEASEIVKIYPSFSDCEAKIIEELKKAQVVKLFTNVGRSDFSKGNKYYDAIVQNRHGEFRFLIADKRSPFISESWAVKHNFTKQDAHTWLERIQLVIDEITHIKNRYHINIEVKGHRHPFVWHYWIIDDSAYVSAFIKKTRAYYTVRVYELKHLDPNQGSSLYEFFDAFFNRIWEEQSYEFDQ